ncbi:MAG: LCP family protein [Actinobacteria bacterium]|nr:LCP family protein [Actinomycetota bacterium]
MNSEVKPVRTGYMPCSAAAVGSVIFPGLGHLIVRARFRRTVIVAAALNLAATVAAIVIAAPVNSRPDLAEVIADRSVFIALGVTLLVLGLTRLWTAVDSAWIARPREGSAIRVASIFTSAAVVIGGVGPLVVAADYVRETDRAIEKVFGDEDATTAIPSPLTTDVTTDGSAQTPTTIGGGSVPARTTTTIATRTSTTTTTVAPFADVERVNVLLLGGDAGPGRYSMRTDTMVLVSIDPATGSTAMISVPRNLYGLPFPPGTPLADRFPDGFEGIANAVYPHVDGHRELAGGGDDAAAQAVKQGIAQFLGIPVHYYVLVDMLGFVRVVDALGGIDIYLPERIHTSRSPSKDLHPVPHYFEAGQHHFDGTEALSYSRTRYSDSDYGRMDRQRCVLGAIAAAATPTALAFGLTDLVSAFGDAVRTDIPRDRLGEMAQLVDRFVEAGGFSEVNTLHLAPPNIETSRWDAAEVRALVTDVLAGTEPEGTKSTSEQCPTS